MSRLVPAFRDQARHCAALDSPFMARLMTLLADHWDPDGSALARRFEAWPGEVGASHASLPLRLAGGLHRLVLSGKDPRLSAVYPPAEADDSTLRDAVFDAMARHQGFLDTWVDSAPQTNEVRRSAALVPAALWLADRFGLPFRLSELGASAGLNLNFDRYALSVQGEIFGPPDPVLTLAPDWSGPKPPRAQLRVAGRRGVDLNPLDAANPADQERLLAYLWPDQLERIARTRAALDASTAIVDRGDAADWLAARLADRNEGETHLIFHTIAWQYFPDEVQRTAEAAIRRAGEAATDAAPLAWLGMEADGAGRGAGVRLRLWPGGHDLALGRADFHGRWIDWQPPAA